MRQTTQICQCQVYRATKRPSCSEKRLSDGHGRDDRTMTRRTEKLYHFDFERNAFGAIRLCLPLGYWLVRKFVQPVPFDNRRILSTVNQQYVTSASSNLPASSPSPATTETMPPRSYHLSRQKPSSYPSQSQQLPPQHTHRHADVVRQ